MNEQQRRTLDAGLAEFDRVVRRRRWMRGSTAIAAFMITLAASGWLLGQRRTPAREALPIYVELIQTPAELGEQLALAEACERVGFEGNRVYLVDCTPRPAN